MLRKGKLTHLLSSMTTLTICSKCQQTESAKCQDCHGQLSSSHALRNTLDISYCHEYGFAPLAKSKRQRKASTLADDEGYYLQ